MCDDTHVSLTVGFMSSLSASIVKSNAGDKVYLIIMILMRRCVSLALQFLF